MIEWFYSLLESFDLLLDRNETPPRNYFDATIIRISQIEQDKELGSLMKELTAFQGLIGTTNR